MNHQNGNNFESDSQSYLYQFSNNDIENDNFIYQDSCVFLHDYKDDHSCQEELLPKIVPYHQEIQQSQPQISCSQVYDQTLTQRQENDRAALHFKHKIIHKTSKINKEKHRKINHTKNINSKPKQIGNKSRFNNFGGFLIGSLAQILNKATSYRISNGIYQIQFSGQLIPIILSKLATANGCSETMVGMIRKLKREVGQLPRKQGAKKHLFRLVNKGAKDNEQRKECKKIIRQQLIYYLSNQTWLNEHVSSRDFQPKGDNTEGMKKKERHKAYLEYLCAIRQALIQKEQLPKRLAL